MRSELNLKDDVEFGDPKVRNQHIEAMKKHLDAQCVEGWDYPDLQRDAADSRCCLRQLEVKDGMKEEEVIETISLELSVHGVCYHVVSWYHVERASCSMREALLTVKHVVLLCW